MNASQAVFAALACAVSTAGALWVLAPLHEVRKAWTRLAATLLPLLAVGAYLALGTPKALDMPVPEAPHAQVPAELESMVQRLQARLQTGPGDVESWVMLARSHQVLEQWDSAARAYRRALVLAPGDPALLADLADVLAVMAQGELEGEPQALLEQALQADPGHPKTLLLLAAADFRHGRFSDARRRWELLLRVVPPESAAAGIARDGLQRLRQMQGAPATASPPPATVPTR